MSASAANAGFIDELVAEIRARRSFGGHPFWHALAAGRVSRAGLRTFARQFYLQVNEFPRAVSALHASCPYADLRRELAESVYEEETGRISGCNLPHPRLFGSFAEAVGVPWDELIRSEPLPSTAALIHWFETSTRNRSFLEGAAAIQLSAEGQVPGAFGPFARALEKHYGLAREAVAFWDVHEIADRDHADVGDHAVGRYAVSGEVRERVRAAVRQSLAAWWQFFDG
ncbi:MAG TPA: iron-containing redox enzyme family protein, partial [Myxococcota bacterium]|nr:iron-containing redox enzyme family protein [Myxococcota bacterium]